MPLYQHVLAAVEATDEGREILVKAQQVARATGARLSVLSVVEAPLLTAPVMADGMIPVTDLPLDASVIRDLQGHAETRLSGWCRQLGIDARALTVVSDWAIDRIVHLAKDEDIDLIVIGHHERHGLAAWFRHTDEKVLNDAPCDVLAVRLASPGGAD